MNLNRASLFTKLIRENEIQERRRFWRMKAAIDRMDPDDPEFDEYRSFISSMVGGWPLMLKAWAEDAAERRPDIHSLWYDVELGDDINGLKEFHERYGTSGEIPPLDVAFRAGRAITNLQILLFDLHPLQPVVESPWSIEEEPTLEELREEMGV